MTTASSSHSMHSSPSPTVRGADAFESPVSAASIELQRFADQEEYVQLDQLFLNPAIPSNHEANQRNSSQPLRHKPPQPHGHDETSSSRVGYSLRRFYLRGVVPILVPIAVTAYFVAIWLLYINPGEEQGQPLKIGRPGALPIFYSWFVIATLGLSLSEYGLVGVEASMLMEPGWAPSNAMQIMMHCERSWGGPGGWLAVARKVFLLWRRHDHPTQWPSKLWVVLASLSALPYIALPLSGLCMELSDGFVDSNGGPVVVIGRNYTTFERRIDDDMIKQATERWRSASVPFIPGQGVAYAPEMADRRNNDWSFLDTLPHTLPVDHGIHEIFLVPQASSPIHGTAWGVVLRYNCSVVSRMLDFTILNHRTGKRENKTHIPGTTDTYIMGRNQSFGGQVFNLQAYMELGSSSYEGLATTWSWFQRYHDPGSTNYTPPPYDAAAGRLESNEVLEVALWQSINTHTDEPPVTHFTPNMDLESTIPELGHEIESLVPGTNESLGYMPAIGARCTSNSAVGAATIDGRRFTFRDFRPGTTLPAAESSDNTAAVRFSCAIPPIILQETPSEPVVAPEEWLYGLFASSQQSTSLVTTGQKRAWLAPSPLQPSSLVRSLLQAHASYALQLEYDSQYGIPGAGGYVDVNVTALPADKVLSAGVVPPVFVVVLLLAWAVISSTMGCWYGFRRRWSQVLDGYSMFRFGADCGDFVRSRPDFGSAADFENCDALRRIPGMVGNLAPSWTPGHIGLVDGVYAPKGALYA